MRSQENPAPLSGPLWPIKDMERAYLKLQHTSPGQTNSLRTPSERPPGTDKYPPIGLRRERVRASERARGRAREEVRARVSRRGHAQKLTFPQIGVSKSQTALFASCPSPAGGRDRKLE